MAEHRKFRLTASKLEELKIELESLKTKGRKEITKRLQDIQSQVIEEMDSPYVEASDERDLLEARIIELEEVLDNSEVIDESKGSKTVEIGAKVTVTIGEKKEKYEYMLVEDIEVDPASGKIAVESPVGVALKGKKVGEEVKVEVGENVITYKIVAIK